MMTSCACPKEAMACTSAGSRSSELAVAGGAAVRLQLAAVSARICSASGWYSSWNAASLSGASGEHHPRCAPGARSGVADGCIGASGVRASSAAAQMSGQRAPRRRRQRIQPRACSLQARRPTRGATAQIPGNNNNNLADVCICGVPGCSCVAPTHLGHSSVAFAGVVAYANKMVLVALFTPPLCTWWVHLQMTHMHFGSHR